MKNFDAYVFGFLAAITLGSYLAFAAALMIDVQTVKPNVERILSVR